MSTLELVARNGPTADTTIAKDEVTSGDRMTAGDEITARDDITPHDRISVGDELLPFGPYRSLPVDQVAVMDPAYLAGLIKAEVGPAPFRAAAARALLTSARYVAAEDVRPPPITLRPWMLVLGAGVVIAVVLGLADMLGTGPLPAPAPLADGSIATSTPAKALSARAPGTAAPERSLSTALSDATPATADSAASPPGPTPADACVARVPGAIAAVAAANYLDTFQAVAFRVVATKDTGKVTFLNSRVPYNGAFYVAIFPTLYDQFPSPPAIFFRDKCIAVQGQVELYRDTPQVVVRTADDIRVVDGN